ncbi:MAG: O-antigen ligase family protein [Clostridia bacterium]|nr:MAG: O-antigen ligase family protein [Clostridia bacterium]
MVFSGLGTAARMVGFLAALVGLNAVFVSGRVRVHPLLGWAFAFVLWSWASFFWSIKPEATLMRAFTYTQLLLATWLIYHFSVQEDRLKTLMWAYILGTWIAVLGTFWVYAQGAEVAYRRFAAEGFDPNDLSFYLNLAMVMAWYLGLHNKRFMKLITWGLIPFASAAVLLTASRAGALGMILALVFVLISLNSLSWKWRVLGLALLLGLGGYLLTAIVPEYSFARLLTIPEELASGTLNQRTVIWGAGLQVFSNHPLLGTGAGSFRFAVEPYLGVNTAPHNAFLAVAVEGGIIGLVLWLGMLAAAFAPMLFRKNSDRVVWTFLLGVLLLAFLSLNFEWRKASWLTIALAAVASAQQRLGEHVKRFKRVAA